MQSTQAILRWKEAVTTGLLTLLATALLLYGLGVLIFAIVQPSDLSNVLEKYVVPPEDFQPEPAERLTYLVILLVGPLLMFGLYEYFSRNARSAAASPSQDGKLFFCSLGVIYSSLLLLSCLGDHFFYLQNTILVDNPVLVVTLVFCLVFVLSRADGQASNLQTLGKATRLVLYGLAISHLFFGVLVRFFPRDDPYMRDSHIEIMFFTAVQVYQGKTLLVDFVHQYGLYPHFLDPIFRLIGLDVPRYSMVMSLLVAAVNGMILYYLARSVRCRSIALLGFCACLFFVDYYIPHPMVCHGIVAFYDPYFQWKPVRMLFPALLLVLSLLDLGRLGPGRHFLILVALSLGVFWNLDSGLPTLVTWLLLLFYDDSFADGARARVRKMLAHGLLAVSALGLAWLIISGCLFVRSGRLPDWRLLTLFQEQFYAAGYYMHPMPLFHSWNILVTLYFGGLLFTWVSWRRGENTSRCRAVLMLSLLGLGQFTYYQGRSHDWVLPNVAVPAFCLATLFLDELVERYYRWGRQPRFLVLPITVVIVVFAALTLRGLGSLGPFVNSARQRLSGGQVDPWMAGDLAFLRAHTSPGETIALLSNFSSVYYLETQTRPAFAQGLLELFQVAELRQLEKVISDAPELKVFADRTLLQTKTPRTNPLLNEALVQYLDDHFTVADRSPSGNLVLYRRKSDQLSEKSAGSRRALAKGRWPIPHMCLVPLAAPATTAITEPRGAFEASSLRDSSSLRLAPEKNPEKRGTIRVRALDRRAMIWVRRYFGFAAIVFGTISAPSRSCPRTATGQFPQ